MYAVIKTGGKQYRVAAGEKLKVESIVADVGSVVTLTEVLAIADGANVRFGTPLLSGAAVIATVLASRAARQGPHLQDAPAQALPEARRTSPELHRTSDRRDQLTGWQTGVRTERAGCKRGQNGTQESGRLIA